MDWRGCSKMAVCIGVLYWWPFHLHIGVVWSRLVPSLCSAVHFSPPSSPQIAFLCGQNTRHVVHSGYRCCWSCWTECVYVYVYPYGIFGFQLTPDTKCLRLQLHILYSLHYIKLSQISEWYFQSICPLKTLSAVMQQHFSLLVWTVSFCQQTGKWL